MQTLLPLDIIRLNKATKAAQYYYDTAGNRIDELKVLPVDTLLIVNNTEGSVNWYSPYTKNSLPNDLSENINFQECTMADHYEIVYRYDIDRQALISINQTVEDIPYAALLAQEKRLLVALAMHNLFEQWPKKHDRIKAQLEPFVAEKLVLLNDESGLGITRAEMSNKVANFIYDSI
jgi:hypothetical protein